MGLFDNVKKKNEAKQLGLPFEKYDEYLEAAQLGISIEQYKRFLSSFSSQIRRKNLRIKEKSTFSAHIVLYGMVTTITLLVIQINMKMFAVLELIE